MTTRTGHLLRLLLLLLAVTAVYWNHLDNEFHFDDAHTIVDNVHIRSLNNIPKFFADARTFSANPSNQMYRPLLTASFALDYWLAGGLETFVFHVTSFVFFLLLLGCLYSLVLGLVKKARPDLPAANIAMLATAWFGLHPVSAETVNYIVQRGDLVSTLGSLAGLLLYVQFPNQRRWGWYLIPVILGMLFKQTGLMFAPLLFLYVWLFETKEERRGVRSFFQAFTQTLPAFIVCAAYYVLQHFMAPPTFTPGGASSLQYALTQPFVYLHYFRSFFLPIDLSADTDWEVVKSFTDERVFVGVAGVLALALWALRMACRPQTRIQAFGLLWFLVAPLPTSSVLPLAEVMNDHRMFFPFVGLVMTFTVMLFDLLAKCRAWATWIGLLLLIPFAYGTVQRNEVWHSEESLWKDVTEKSPRNGRGLMNYGLTLMEKGDYDGALDYFNRAKQLTPQYYILDINLGVLHGAMKHPELAEPYFREALALGPARDPLPRHYYARWLLGQQRYDEALQLLAESLQKDEFYLPSHYLLLNEYKRRGDVEALRRASNELLQFVPDDATAKALLEFTN